MKPVILLIISLAICLTVPSGVWAKTNRIMMDVDSSHVASVVLQKDGSRYDFKIDLALTREQQAHGLMDRTSLGAESGMLFYFSDEAERAFWMKNTLIPLDMIFIKKDGTISHIHENARPGDLTPVPSEGPAQAVLEVNGGTAAALGLKKGDKVHHILFGNSLAM